MLLYFGSRRMMHQPNTCLCDVHHSRPDLWDLPEHTFVQCPHSVPGRRRDKALGNRSERGEQDGAVDFQRIPFRHG